MLVWVDRRFRLRHGRIGRLCVALYRLGRVWLEMIRIDEGERVPGLRLNVWTAIPAGVGALVAFTVVGRRHPERDTTLLLAPPAEQDEQAPETVR